MKKVILLGLFCSWTMAANAQVDMVFSLIEEVTGAMNEMKVFANMDEKLREMRDLQQNLQDIKEPLNKAKAAKDMYEMIAFYEKAACGMKDYLDLKTQYDQTMWSKWDRYGASECLTQVNHDFFVDQGLKLVERMNTTATMIDNAYLSQKEIDEYNAMQKAEMEKLIADLNAKMEEMRPKVFWAQQVQAFTDDMVMPYEIDLGNYDPMQGGGVDEFENEFDRSGKNIFFTIIRMVLGISIIPVVLQVMKQNYNPLIGWAVALVIATIAQNILG